MPRQINLSSFDFTLDDVIACIGTGQALRKSPRISEMRPSRDQSTCGTTNISKSTGYASLLIRIGQRQPQFLKYCDCCVELPDVLQCSCMTQNHIHRLSVRDSDSRSRRSARESECKLFEGLLSPTIKMADADAKVAGNNRVQLSREIAANDDDPEGFRKAEDRPVHALPHVGPLSTPSRNERIVL